MKKRTMVFALLFSFIMLFFCICISGCDKSTLSDAADASSDLPVDGVPEDEVPAQEEKAPVTEETANSPATTQPESNLPVEGSKNEIGFFIESIVNHGGEINFYYSAQNEAGEKWEGRIAFHANGGATPEGAAMTLDQEKKFFNLACPFFYQDHVFLGWSLEPSGKPYLYETNDRFSAYPIEDIIALAIANDKSGDLTFYAIWGQSCVITYNANKPAGTTQEVTGLPGQNPAVWEHGKIVVLAQAPTLTGWQFDGWYLEATCQTKIGDAGEILPSNRNMEGRVHLYAKWVGNSYNVIYNANKPTNASGTVMEMPTQNPAIWTYDQNETLAGAPTLTGWKFEGWFKDVDCKIKLGNAKEVLTKPNLVATGTVDLYAKWVETSYEVVYNANKPQNASGTVNAMPTQNPAVWIYDQNATLAAAPTLTGWSFMGWFKDADCKNKVGNAKDVLTKPNFAIEGKLLLYAGWEPQSITITFDKQGGFDGTSNATATYGSTMPSVVVPAREGSTFDGYYSKPNGMGTKYYSATGASLCMWDKITDTTLYANWTANSNIVIFDLQGGSGGTEKGVATYASAMPTITVPTRSGYIFDGYYTGTNGTGTQYYTNKGTSAKNWDKNTTITLYAKWTIESYNLVFDSNASAAILGRVSGSANQTAVTYGQTITLPILSCDYCTFNGWLIGSSTTPVRSWTVTDAGSTGVSISAKASWTRNFTSITSAAEFSNIRNNPNKTYLLMKDIDLSGGFEPIEELKSEGVLDGNGYTIKNWTYTHNASYYYSKSNVSEGLFKVNRGTIKNLNLQNIKIDLDACVDSMEYFFVGALCGSNYGNIEYVIVKSSHVKGQSGTDTDVARHTGVGGLCGTVYSGDIHHCGAANNNIYVWSKVRSTTGSTYCGALIGAIQYSNTTSNLYDLFANNNVIFADAHGGCSGYMFLGIGWWSGIVNVHVAGLVGIYADRCKTFTRCVSVNNSITGEDGSDGWGVGSGYYHRYSDTFCYGATPVDQLISNSISNLKFDAVYQVNGWRKNTTNNELYFVK